MFNRLFRASANRAVINNIHGKIVAAARQPVLFADYGVPDTREGRFEMVVLHAMLVLRQLRNQPAPGPEMAQAVSDAVFANFDAGLREMGVGDPAIPKRITSFAAAFVGRCTAYEAALKSPDDATLQAALQRNVFAPLPGDTLRLARYVRACATGLASATGLQPGQDSIVFASAQDVL